MASMQTCIVGVHPRWLLALPDSTACRQCIVLAAALLFASEWHLWETVAAGLIIQLLVGSKILDVDTNVKADRDLMWVPRTDCAI